MTVVRPNSIAGINSITVQTGQALNIHDASGNLIRNITSSSGVSTFSSLHVGSGTTTNTQGISVGTGCSIVSGTVNTLDFYTNNNDRLRIHPGGQVSIRNTNASSFNTGGDDLVIGDATDGQDAGITLYSHSSDNCSIFFNDTASTGVTGLIQYRHDSDALKVNTAGTERARIDSSGRLIVGHTASEAMFYTGLFQVQGTSSSTSAITVKTNQNDSGGPAIVLGKSRGSLGGSTVVQSGDELGCIYFAGADGTDTNSRAAAIRCQVDGTPGGNDMPGRLQFMTTADGASTETERMRIDSSGRLLIGHTSSLGEVWNDDGGSLQVAGTSYLNSTFQISRWTNSASCPHFIMGKSRGGAVGTNVIVQDGDTCGIIAFAADDGTDLHSAVAEIRAQVDGTPGSNDTPGRLIFSTTADGSNSRTEHLRIDQEGLITIGGGIQNQEAASFNSGANQLLITSDGATGLTIDATSSTSSSIHFADGSTGSESYRGIVEYNHSNDYMSFATGGTHRLRITSDGSMLAGTTNTNDTSSGGLKIETVAVDGTANALNIRNPQTSGANAAVGIVFNMDRTTGGIHFNAGGIEMHKRQEWTTTPSTVDSYISLKTIVDETPAERCRIGYNKASAYFYHVDDEITIASSSTADIGATLCAGTDQNYHIFASNSQTCMFIGRQTDDGTLVDFRQAGTSEGSISVSGSTVSYNGGHLSRWSQLPGLSNTDTSARPTIYRGTIMSNLDEMCEWTGEENLQLNKTQVSTAASDPNVAGIFWEWDDQVPVQGESHDYKNDFYIAMTGDTIIRVGAGVSVTKGDLLESAGDGTARPQSDDIIRSKTIAKVMSNVGIVTYADNSYCVPCLLMAC